MKWTEQRKVGREGTNMVLWMLYLNIVVHGTAYMLWKMKEWCCNEAVTVHCTVLYTTVYYCILLTVMLLFVVLYITVY